MHRWQLIGGSDPNGLKPIGPEHDATGFETALDVPGSPRYVAVRALGKDGTTLGTSRAITPG